MNAAKGFRGQLNEEVTLYLLQQMRERKELDSIPEADTIPESSKRLTEVLRILAPLLQREQREHQELLDLQEQVDSLEESDLSESDLSALRELPS